MTLPMGHHRPYTLITIIISHPLCHLSYGQMFKGIPFSYKTMLPQSNFSMIFDVNVCQTQT